MSLYSEIKKYLLYLVAFFCLLIGAHLVLLYMYHDAVSYPLPGGTMNVGVIDTPPSMSVLAMDTKLENNSSDMITRFLYRSIVRYSLEDKKIVGDITNCNLDTFPNVRCTLNQNALWDDGTALSVEDIIATYAALREQSTNEVTRSRLALVDVSQDKGDAIFRFRTNDITLIDVLFLPILRKQDLSALAGVQSLTDRSFSGPFTLVEHDTEGTVFLLKKNPNYTAQGIFFADQIRFAFGEDRKTVSRKIEPDVWISDEALEDGDFSQNLFSRPLFYGIYLNTARVPVTLRNALFQDVFQTLDLANEPDFVTKDTVFLGDITGSPRGSAESLFYQTVFSLGYSFGGVAAPIEAPAPEARPTPLTHISQPGNVTPLFLSSDVIEIQGSVPEKTNKVVVNDYILKNFDPQSKRFSYKARREFENLIEGENAFKVQFFENARLIAEETLIVYHSLDPNNLNVFRDAWKKKNAPATPPAPSPAVESIKTDPKKLYDKAQKQLTFVILVQSDVPLFETAVQHVEKTLTNLGAAVVIERLPLADIRRRVSEENPNYDLVLAGVNLGLFHYNIMPFFHSGQIKNGFNIARIRNATLDSQLEKLIARLYYNAPDRLRLLQNDIQKILEAESVIFPLGSPQESLLIKQHVLGVSVPTFFSGRELLRDILASAYFKEGYRRSDESKTLTGFFSWLIHVLFSRT